MRALLAALLLLPLAIGGALALQALGAGLADAIASLGAGAGAALPWLAGGLGVALALGVPLIIYGEYKSRILYEEFQREERRRQWLLATRTRWLDRGQE